MKSGRRQLAAIMFTDMVGYTALMQEDERLAKLKRDRHRKVLQESIKKYNGDVLQFYGDGTLSMFNSGVEAVWCAIAIQQELKNEPAVPLRIGIHTGDIVFEEDGVYGDGVNVASRLESLSVAGSILISEKLQDELFNQPDLKTISLGKYKLKNLKRLIEVYAVSANGIAVPSPYQLSSEKVESSKSIAVLPFINMSNDTENEYFSDGITEEILNALVKVEGLQVTSRTSSFAFKGKITDVKAIARQLNVNNILEGSVRKAGNRVRITAQLINAGDDFHIWSETYDRNLEDIFEVQDEIAKKIANTLREKLTMQQKDEQLVTTKTENLDVYNLYLKGKFHLFKWSPDEAKKGLEFLNNVIAKEENFAPAHSMLAFCYVLLGAMGHLRTSIAYEKAKTHAQRALEIDNTLADAYTSLGLVKIFTEWDLDGAYKAFQEALKLQPGDAGIHHAYMIYLTAADKLDEAIESIKYALKLDPLSLPINQSLGEAYLNAGRYTDALDQLNKTLDLDPNFRAAIETKGWALFFLGRTEEAVETFKDYQRRTGSPLKGLAGLGYVLARAGKAEEAKDILEKLKQRGEQDKNVSLHMDFLIVYAGLKDFDKVFYHLEKAIEDGNIAYFLRIHPLGDEIRNDPRYEKAIEKIGGHK
jgi:TolB-like protein/Tfp pilus assembly protein PilF